VARDAAGGGRIRPALKLPRGACTVSASVALVGKRATVVVLHVWPGCGATEVPLAWLYRATRFSANVCIGGAMVEMFSMEISDVIVDSSAGVKKAAIRGGCLCDQVHEPLRFRLTQHARRRRHDRRRRRDSRGHGEGRVAPACSPPNDSVILTLLHLLPTFSVKSLISWCMKADQRMRRVMDMVVQDIQGTAHRARRRRHMRARPFMDTRLLFQKIQQAVEYTTICKRFFSFSSFVSSETPAFHGYRPISHSRMVTCTPNKKAASPAF
jgi:hypothetical protein